MALPYAWLSIDNFNNETQSAAFLKTNLNGKIPLLETPDGDFLPEPNAILHFLAEATLLLPKDRREHGQVLQWLFDDQYSNAPYIATARFIVRYLGRPSESEATCRKKWPRTIRP